MTYCPSMWNAWSLLIAGCLAAPPSSNPNPTEPVMPSHQSVLQAVQVAGDAELEDWVSVPGEYALGAVAVAGIDRHTIYEVTPGAVSHPMHFFIAVEDGTGEVFVTSSPADGRARLVHGEPGLLGTAGGVATAVRLVADTPDRTRVVEDGAHLSGAGAEVTLQVLPPQVQRDGGAVRVTVHVVDHAARLQRWDLHLPSSGAATWKRTTLARGVKVVAP